MSDTPGKGTQPLKEQVDRFQKLLAELEDILDRGFFVSMLGRVAIDEKRVFEVLAELQKLDFEPPPEKKREKNAGNKPPRRLPENLKPPDDADEVLRMAYAEAESIRRGANEYADRVLANLEQRVENIQAAIKEGQRVLADRIEKT